MEMKTKLYTNELRVNFYTINIKLWHRTFETVEYRASSTFYR